MSAEHLILTFFRRTVRTKKEETKAKTKYKSPHATRHGKKQIKRPTTGQMEQPTTKEFNVHSHAVECAKTRQPKW
jgi:hypothetical protein